jgi:Rrf2 family protein
MLLTKESDYSIRILRALADGSKRTVKSICDVEFVPIKFAYKILKKLENAGFVQSSQGPKGGYCLIKPLEGISLYDIISVIDEDVFLFHCLKEGNYCPNNEGTKQCSLHCEFDRIQNVIKRELQAKSMDELI